VQANPDNLQSLAVLGPPSSVDGRGAGLPLPITLAEYRAILARTRSIRDRLLVRLLWESGARISEVLGLRPADVDHAEGALRLVNRKQRKASNRSKLVYVSRDLCAELDAYARAFGVRKTDRFLQSRQGLRLSPATGWRVVTAAASAAGVRVEGRRGELVPASPLNFRHGNAVHQLRSGVPITEVQRQLGHSRIESTLVYTKLTNPQRREFADRRFQEDA